MKPSFLWILCAAVLAVPAIASAQGIRGVVTDPHGLPVDGAKVIVLGAAVEVWTDAHGRYEIQHAPAGQRTVLVLSEDFEAAELQVEVAGTGRTTADLQFAELRSSKASIEVVGHAVEVLMEIPGSVYSISKQELGESRPADANEVLRRVPGITIREDSGPVAMRLNVGVRGLNPDRSRKVLMMEDGIPIALAPYGEPEMYYSPPIDRMQRVEVLKGSGQIVHGPQTVGGVINFVTPDPPPTTHGSLDVEGGQRGLFFGNASLGGSNGDQSAGWLLNFLRKQGHGWRGFCYDINDAQSKFTWKPGERNTFGLKLGFYDETSNSTYLGLTQRQFEVGPNINVVPSDRLVVRRYSASVSHTAALNPNAVWNTAVFAYKTIRNWGRQDWDRLDRGWGYLSVEGDPSIPGGAIYLLNSAGNRNREFNVAGLQSGVSVNHVLAGIRGKLDLGARYLYEKADDTRIDGDRFDARAGTVNGDEDRFGKALSAYLQNRFFLGQRVILTPGVRLESYNYGRHIFRQRVETPDGLIPMNVDVRRSDAITAAIPGLGLSVRANKTVTVFAGVHRGFAPPYPKNAITQDGESLDLDAEFSWNFEAGVRFQTPRLLLGEVTLFRLDFENQIITASESGGATTTLVNGGETLHQGVETSLRVNWNELFGSPVLVYTDVRHTHLGTARFTRNELFEGNRLPYAPHDTFSLLLGVRQRQGFGFQLDVTYVAGQFGDNHETVKPSNDGTIGMLPSYAVWNLIADYTMRRERLGISPYLTVKNLGDALYIASRAPQGIQPGMFRQVNAGLRFTF